MNPQPICPRPILLNSWKQIAIFLGRGVRTVQRWEEELNLPVHRIGTGKRAPVFALEHELRFWLQVRRYGPTHNDPAGVRGSTVVHAEFAYRSTELAQRVLAATEENRRLMTVLVENMARMQQTRDEIRRVRLGRMATRGFRSANPHMLDLQSNALSEPFQTATLGDRSSAATGTP